ncbi:MAG: iron-sulfur cluster assembly scaffold protein [Desulfocapsaceae bacterium]|nr:iron-sulfur cluster assembly scaffold protein [Desulfocapsaceae bacterium]
MSKQLSGHVQGYSEHFIDLASRTSRLGILASPDGYGKGVSNCGDTVELYLSVRDGLIQTIFFQIQGCLNTNACANALSVLAEGKSIADGWRLLPEDLVVYLQTLPPDHSHCADLVVEAFHRALNDYSATRHEPWQKAYLKQ